MNIVQAGDTIRIYGTEISVSSNLPVGTYNVKFSPMSGFYLIPREDLVVKEDKIYGTLNDKIDKTLKSFSLCDRNFGVLLSGQKGSGKSLFARRLAMEGTKLDIPTIVVEQYFPNLNDFLSQIQQTVIVIFDEFEKIFKEDKESGYNPQVELLTLFDGLDSGKKLFVVICNDTKYLSRYLLNRPGRFHYHFKMNSLTEDETATYLLDNLQKEYHNIIPKIIDLLPICNITYDILRAISFDINQGYKLSEVLRDLNVEIKQKIYVTVYLKYNNGISFVAHNLFLDLTEKSSIIWYLSTLDQKMRGKGSIKIEFKPCDLNVKDKKFIIDIEKIDLIWDGNIGIGIEEEDKYIETFENIDNIKEIYMIPSQIEEIGFNKVL